MDDFNDDSVYVWGLYTRAKDYLVAKAIIEDSVMGLDYESMMAKDEKTSGIPIGDLRQYTVEFDFIFNLWLDKNSVPYRTFSRPKQSAEVHAEQFCLLYNGVAIGDYVIWAPYWLSDDVFVAVITGDYVYEAGHPIPHQRRIEWVAEKKRSDFVYMDEFGKRRALYLVDSLNFLEELMDMLDLSDDEQFE